MALAYLMRFRNHSLHEAIQLVRNAESILSFNLAKGYRDALEMMEELLTGSRSGAGIWNGMFIS